MKRQKPATFVKKSSIISALMIKIIWKIKTVAIIQVNTEVVHM